MVRKSKTSEAEETLVDEEASTETARTVVCGGLLREEREAQKLTVQSVASQLRLSSPQIEALEQDDFSALPEPTIVKGFIRNYAKLLKIPAEPVLEAYAELAPSGERYEFALAPGINMKMTEGSKPKKNAYYLVLIALLLMGVGAWLLYQYYIQKPDVVSPISEALPESLALQMPQVSVEATPPQVVAGVPSEATDTPVTVENETATEADATGDAGAGNGQREAEVAEAKLTFNATQETWLSVVDISGAEVYNKILYAGDQDTLYVINPREVTVGNAHGVTLTVDGGAIDLAPYIRGNVARIRLDQ